MTNRVVAYARVSTDKQDADNQRFEIERYAEKHSLVITDYVDEVVSGFKVQIANRKISDVLHELTAGDTIIVSEVSRISRRLIDILNTIQDCIEKGITVIAVKESFVFEDNINSKVIAFAFGLAAEIERTLISQRTKEALAKKKAEGVVLGRPVGTGKPEHYKLHGRDDELIELIRARVAVSAIARIMGVHRQTATTYIDMHELRRKARTELGV